MKTAFFWIVWGIISTWTLKTFYYSFSKEKLDRLRKAAFGISLSVLVLSFLPWVPLSMGGKSGLALAFEGNFLAVLFIMLLGGSLVSFLLNNGERFKLGILATIGSTFLLFAVMLQLRPVTFTITWYDIAPIIAVMLLLVGDVVVLLLWQQLQLLKKKGRKKRKS